MSQRELAILAGTTRQYISSVLGAPITSLVTLEKLAAAVGKDVRITLVDRAATDSLRS